MRKIKPKPSGELMPRDLRFFGGEYSFFEKLKLKGVGSPKLIYLDGNNKFDAIDRKIEWEIPFVNFELLKNGLIARLNQNQRTAPIGFKLDDIKRINLIGFKIHIKTKTFRGYKTKIVHRGELEIITEEKIMHLNILTKDFASVVQYFKKEPLINLFNYTISKLPTEEDQGIFRSLLEIDY